jgi:hypothetical protein
MMLWILFVIIIVDLALLLCVCNIVLDIKEYLMYKECLNDESDL